MAEADTQLTINVSQSCVVLLWALLHRISMDYGIMFCRNIHIYFSLLLTVTAFRAKRPYDDKLPFVLPAGRRAYRAGRPGVERPVQRSPLAHGYPYGWLCAYEVIGVFGFIAP